MPKSEISDLYDILGSREARQKFEEKLIDRLRKKLEMIDGLVEGFREDAAACEGIANETRVELDNLERQVADGILKEGEIADNERFVSYVEIISKSIDYSVIAGRFESGWIAVIAILQAIVGEYLEVDEI